MQFCFLTNVWSTLAAETKPAPAHFLFTFHSSAGRAHHERINEGKTDDLKSNKNEEREFLCAVLQNEAEFQYHFASFRTTNIIQKLI